MTGKPDKERSRVAEGLRQHQAELRACALCPRMQGPAVTGLPVPSPVMLIGQAPGPKEREVGRPFAWTAGRTLFRWFGQLGIEEDRFRRRVYMAAVCRCFPGKKPQGGDRVPAPSEIANCSRWLQKEQELLRPKLILPVGRLAIDRFLEPARLDQIVGRQFPIAFAWGTADLVPLPHPSGASVWHRVEPGKTLLAEALELVARHPAWRRILDSA